MRKLAFWLVGLICVVAGTAGLLVFATSGATVFRVEDAGRTVYIEGPITGAGTERFQRILEQEPDLRLVALGDMPGASDANWLLAIGYLIRDAGLATEARGAIDNDAIFLLMAGVERRIDDAVLLVTDAVGARDLGLPFDRSSVAVSERAAFIRDMTGRDDITGFFEDLRNGPPGIAGVQVTLSAEQIEALDLITQ